MTSRQGRVVRVAAVIALSLGAATRAEACPQCQSTSLHSYFAGTLLLSFLPLGILLGIALWLRPGRRAGHGDEVPGPPAQ